MTDYQLLLSLPSLRAVEAKGYKVLVERIPGSDTCKLNQVFCGELRMPALVVIKELCEKHNLTLADWQRTYGDKSIHPVSLLQALESLRSREPAPLTPQEVVTRQQENKRRARIRAARRSFVTGQIPHRKNG